MPVWMAPARAEAERAFAHFTQAYDAKYPKAVECLRQDRQKLLAVYDFPAEHWRHLRTSKTRGCLSRKTAMVYKLGWCAQNGWRRLNGSELLTDVVGGVIFKNGVRVTEQVSATEDAA